MVSMEITSDDTKLLTITETGYGRISPISDYRLQSRGGKGLTNYRVEKYGDVAASSCGNGRRGYYNDSLKRYNNKNILGAYFHLYPSRKGCARNEGGRG